MKKYYLTFILSLFLFPVFAQKTDTIHSEKLNEDRIITISLPASYGKEKNKKYPLLLILDGDYLFEPFTGSLKYGNYWDDLPEVIVVGINQSRPFDRELDSNVDLEKGLPFEKGAKFFDFIGMELIPALEKKYEYGLIGLAKVLGCSRSKAAKLKSTGILDNAIIQNGHHIIIDKEKAMELMALHKK